MSPRTSCGPWWAALLLVAAAADGRPVGGQPPGPPSAAAPAAAGPPPIEDNSFLLEEAYNQPRGVVQHVTTFAGPVGGRGWAATFTQEWPLGGRVHQFSYTAAALRPGDGHPARLGDLALNYRLETHNRRGVLVTPRASVVLPTGSARAGAGAGGVGLQTNLPVTLELTPRWSTHTNVGGTLVPRGQDAGGARTRAANVTLAQSVIWLARPTFNVLLETVWSRTATAADGGRAVDRQTIVSPGVRYAVNRPSGMQVVPGLAVPLVLVGPPGRVHAEPAVFAYLSIEHGFGPRCAALSARAPRAGPRARTAWADAPYAGFTGTPPACAVITCSVPAEECERVGQAVEDGARRRGCENRGVRAGSDVAGHSVTPRQRDDRPGCRRRGRRATRRRRAVRYAASRDVDTPPRRATRARGRSPPNPTRQPVRQPPRPPAAPRTPLALAVAAAIAIAATAAGVAATPAAAQPPLAGPPRDTARAADVRDDARFDFAARGPYRAAVPRPEALLGYRLGDRNTQYAEQERVLLAIARAAPDRVRVEEIGATHEGRRMRLYVVSSPENIARLDAVRGDLDRLADPRALGAGEADAIARRTPVVVWINESVHGNESPGFETGMQLLYQLAASEEPATLAALRGAVVVLNPSSNPDGHERFAVWYNSVARRDPANDSFEHREPWSIQGRYNHYRFDMNRDVIASTQPEVQAIMRGMLRWHPQVAVDQHGQVGTYFFPPAAAPVNRNIGPASEKWLAAIGRANAAAFDRYGWQYFVRDQFDLYYPGYWDTWPSLTGATGMTYETDGGGWKGLLWRRDDGSLLSFRDGIAKHWVSAMATIEATAARAAERLTDYAAFRRSAVDAGRAGPMRQVVIVPGADPQRAAELAAALVRAGVEVRRAEGAFSSARAHAYAPGAPAGAAARQFAAGAYVVDLAQPQGHLARAVLEPAPTLEPAFARRQEERFRRNQRRADGAGAEDPEFYDITAWSLPIAFGAEAYWTEDAAAPRGRSCATRRRRSPARRAPPPPGPTPRPTRRRSRRRRSRPRRSRSPARRPRRTRPARAPTRRGPRSAATCCRWPSTAASPPARGASPPRRRRRSCSAPSAPGRRASPSTCSPPATGSPSPPTPSRRAGGSGRAAPSSCARRATTRRSPPRSTGSRARAAWSSPRWARPSPSARSSASARRWSCRCGGRASRWSATRGCRRPASARSGGRSTAATAWTSRTSAGTRCRTRSPATTCS
jgi:hypothetical protein